MSTSTMTGSHEPSTSPPATAPSLHPKDLAFPLRLSPHTTLHVKLTQLAACTLVFITTTDHSSPPSASALGSFVYAMPNRLSPADALGTALCSSPGSVDFATRAAKILARRSGLPTYVGCSASFAGATVEEEVEGVRVAIEAVMREIGVVEAGEGIKKL